MTALAELRDILLKDPEVRAEYERLGRALLVADRHVAFDPAVEPPGNTGNPLD